MKTVKRKTRGVQETTRRLEIKTGSDPKILGLYPERNEEPLKVFKQR